MSLQKCISLHWKFWMELNLGPFWRSIHWAKEKTFKSGFLFIISSILQNVKLEGDRENNSEHFFFNTFT